MEQHIMWLRKRFYSLTLLKRRKIGIISLKRPFSIFYTVWSLNQGDKLQLSSAFFRLNGYFTVTLEDATLMWQVFQGNIFWEPEFFNRWFKKYIKYSMVFMSEKIFQALMATISRTKHSLNKTTSELWLHEISFK